MASLDELAERPALANLIGGEWLPARSGETYLKRGPHRPSEPIGSFPSSAAEDVDLAVEAAKQAFAGWARLPGSQRAATLVRTAEALEARQEQVARDMTAEMGKPLREARLEAARAALILRFFAGEAFRPTGEMYEASAPGGLLYTVRRPVGTVGLIAPWNFPIAIPTWKAAPALVFGNTVVLKLALESPLTGLHLAECFQEAGLPAGVLNVLTGPGSKVGARIVSHPDVRRVSFTGSVEVGTGIRAEAARLGKPVQLEMGGHNPLIVMADASLDRAVEAAFAGAFWSAGQKCTATRRIYVQSAVYDEFRRRLLARIENAAVGDPSDPSTEVGPLVNERQLQDVLEAIERGRQEGGTLLAGGERLDGEAYLVAPTLFENVADGAFLSCQEVFGPVSSLYRFDTVEEALERANAVTFGLSASLFTSDLATVHRFVDELEAGMLHVNSQTAGADPHVPFGGLKSSAWGPHEQGRAALEFYTESVTVYQDV